MYLLIKTCAKKLKICNIYKYYDLFIKSMGLLAILTLKDSKAIKSIDFPVILY